MTSTPCDGCGRRVRAAGGQANVWTFGADAEGSAFVLECADGSTYLLCSSCLEALPAEPARHDVEALSSADR